MIPELTGMLEGIVFGRPESLTDQLKPILSNVNIFGIDLYEAGLGEKIGKMVRQMLEGKGAVRRTLAAYIE